MNFRLRMKFGKLTIITTFLTIHTSDKHWRLPSLLMIVQRSYWPSSIIVAAIGAAQLKRNAHFLVLHTKIQIPTLVMIVRVIWHAVPLPWYLLSVYVERHNWRQFILAASWFQKMFDHFCMPIYTNPVYAIYQGYSVFGCRLIFSEVSLLFNYSPLSMGFWWRFITYFLTLTYLSACTLKSMLSQLVTWENKCDFPFQSAENLQGILRSQRHKIQPKKHNAIKESITFYPSAKFWPDGYCRHPLRLSGRRIVRQVFVTGHVKDVKDNAFREWIDFCYGYWSWVEECFFRKWPPSIIQNRRQGGVCKLRFQSFKGECIHTMKCFCLWAWTWVGEGSFRKWPPSNIQNGR